MTWEHEFKRMQTYERIRCAQHGDDTQPCNDEGAAWDVTITHRGSTRSRSLCSNHAARLAHQHSLPFPPAHTHP